MQLINRQYYLDKIEKHLGKDTIIILVGQRRIGKSYVLRLFKAAVESRPGINVIYVNKEKKEYDNIRTYSDLNTYIEEQRHPDVTNYILVDEIQDIREFERTVRSYYEEPDVEIVVTGSNSSMLSSDLSSRIGGRYKEIHIHALSYPEFLTFHGLPDSDESLAKYIRLGGLPGLRKVGLDEQDAREYQLDVYSTVLLKDVISRHEIRNVPFLENLTHFLADNTGKLISASSISRYMKSQGETVTTAAVISYTKHLCESYMLNRAERYDIHGKRLFESNDKFYFEDHGLRNALAGESRDGDIEKVIENIVYCHLVRLGYKVTVGQLQAGEIDFVCMKTTGERTYVQASYLIADNETRKREFGNLHAIEDNYPKYVVSLNPMLWKADDNGVTHLHLRKFLTEGLD